MAVLRRFVLASMIAGTSVTGGSAPPAQALAPELLFSQYIEGSSNNKALEIYNGTGAHVDLAANSYNVQMFFNGNPVSTLTINLTGSVANGDVFVLAQATANAEILAQADQTNGAGWFNGDDAVVLRRGSVVLDVIGQTGSDPGTEWGAGLTSTADNTLRRNATVCQGDPVGTDPFDPAVDWEGFAIDTIDGLGAHTANCDGDAAPTVTATSPTNGAAAVARDTNIAVTFSEPVNVAGSWFTISCANSGPHPAVAGGGPTTFTLDPDVDFGPNEVCTATIVASGVTDQDGDDPPDNIAADTSVSFTTVDALVCGDPATPIHQIQGSGASSPLVGAPGVGRSIEGVVVGDYQGAGQFSGFYVQEEDADADADPATSEGIFVFNNTPVAAGDVVRVRGNVVEFASGSTTLTELTSVTSVLVCATGNNVTSTAVQLPVGSVSDWERYEGMLVSLQQQLAVTETFTLGRFGEVGLSLGSRLFNPTSVVEPGSPALAFQDLNNRSRILLDDGNNQQNIDPTLYPAGGLSASNTLRSGDTVPSLDGVLDQRFSLYRIQPVGAVQFTAANPRPASPADVGGAVKVASMNVLNFFNGDGLGDGFPTSRGADTPFELGRQRDKIVSAIVEMDADIIGLMEIENDEAPNSAIEELTVALNAVAGDGTYAFIDTGVVGTDEIRVALLYQPASVTPAGDFSILTSAVDPRFIDTLNRPALAQTFSENANGQRFTVVVNHLKSKGSDCEAVGDPDTGDGQGNCNVTRTRAAEALADWLATDPTHSGDDDVLIIGDLNSYAKEDPIETLKTGGYTNLVESFLGQGAYSFVFDGQSGYLDHALANESLVPQITGVTEWHVNADEPVVLDYNVEFKSANHVNTLYAPTPFRSSDHDPVIVGVCQPPTLAMSVSPSVLRPPNHKYRTVTATPEASPDVTDIELLSVTSDEPDNGPDDGDTINDIVVLDDLRARLRAERSESGDGRTYTFTWEATNACGATTTATATVSVPLV
jgi:uncharacterized protein